MFAGNDSMSYLLIFIIHIISYSLISYIIVLIYHSCFVCFLSTSKLYYPDFSNFVHSTRTFFTLGKNLFSSNQCIKDPRHLASNSFIMSTKTKSIAFPFSSIDLNIL